MTAPCIVGEGLNPSDEMDSYDNDYQMQHKTITVINKGRRTGPEILIYSIKNNQFDATPLKPRIDLDDV